MSLKKVIAQDVKSDAHRIAFRIQAIFTMRRVTQGFMTSSLTMNCAQASRLLALAPTAYFSRGAFAGEFEQLVIT